MSTSLNHAVDETKRSTWSKAGLAPVRLTDLAQDFFHNRVAINGAESTQSGTGEHAAVSSHLSQEELAPGQPTKATMKNDVEEDIHCRQFAEVLRSFEDSLPDNLKTRFDLQAKHTWSEVISEAEIAEIKYNNKASKESPFGRVRGFFRILRSSSPALQNWLGLLPTESAYGSLICGGLKLILRAATRMDEIKEFVVRAIAVIPDEIEKAQLLIDYNENQDTNRRLHNSVSSLYSAIFDILNDIIAWYRERSLKRHAKAFLQQNTYERQLEAKIDAFKSAVSDVKCEAEICGFRRLQLIDERTRQYLELQKEIVLMLRSSPKIDFHTGQWRQLALAGTAAIAGRRRAISRQSLCEAVLRYDEEAPWIDLATIIRGGSNLDLKAQDRIVYVIESEALKAWLLNSKNAALLIRGSSEAPQGGTSAISFVSAHVVQSTQKTRHTSRLISLFWFAKQHRNTRSDADANVHGVMRSLIGQLVHAYNDFDLYFIKRSHAIAIRDENDIKTLCDVFDSLVFQLPEKTITICVIDWLACLEYNERHEVRYLVQRLLSIVRHSNENGSIFKLLLTHAGGTFWAAGTFAEKGDVLDVPEDGNGRGMGFNKLMWNAKVDDKFNQLVTSR